MVSVIVCSLSKTPTTNFLNNVEESIGVPFELVHIDNSENKYSIFSAHNKGIQLSKYEILCFVHEDVSFHTKRWGDVLVRYFTQISDIGCIGIAGATYKTKAPSAWWDVEERNKVSHLIQWDKEKRSSFESRGWNDKPWRELSVIDGVFMAVKKSNGLTFDGNLSGFHCYDLNLSIEAKKKNLKVIATNEILIEHFSIGNVDKQWIIATHEFHRKNSDFLPINNTGGKIDEFLENDNLVRFIKDALTFGLSQIAFYYWIKYLFLKPVSRQHVEIIKMFLGK